MGVRLERAVFSKRSQVSTGGVQLGAEISNLRARRAELRSEPR